MLQSQHGLVVSWLMNLHSAAHLAVHLAVLSSLQCATQLTVHLVFKTIQSTAKP